MLIRKNKFKVISENIMSLLESNSINLLFSVPTVLIDSIASDSICLGFPSFINDNLVVYTFSKIGFSDCYDNLDGWIDITLLGMHFVAYVGIFTPHGGR